MALKGIFKKNNYSFYVPTSRQQKAIDFIMLNDKTSTSLRLQVKGSRPYSSKDSLGVRSHTFWFSNFYERCIKEQEYVDYYILFGIYDIYTVNSTVSGKKNFWQHFLLLFTAKEMLQFLSEIKQKRHNKLDKFFYIKFSDLSKVIVTRGRQDQLDITNHLLINKKSELINKLSLKN